MKNETKDFLLTDVKADEQSGTFEGWLSVYDIVDLGNDVVERGAFTKTLQESGSTVPLLWQHDAKMPIGTLSLQERAEGLWASGKLLLDIQTARDAYAYIKAGIVRGLSIGFRPIQKAEKDGVRRLKEIKLFEGSLVTFPMLPVAQVSAFKSGADGETKADFLTELEISRTWAMRALMLQAFERSLETILWNGDMSKQERLDAAAVTIDQFRAAFLAFLPTYFEAMGMKSAMVEETKAGRRLSSATRTQIEEAITRLKALLEDEDDTSSAEAVDSTTKAAEISPEPEPLHSAIEAIKNFKL